MENKETQFQPGDIVRLKSGSPRMTVTGYAGQVLVVVFWNESKAEFSEIQGVDAAFIKAEA